MLSHPRYVPLLKQMLVSHAVRELRAAQNFGHVLSMLVPDSSVPIDAVKVLTRQIAEEGDHYDATRTVLANLVGGYANADALIMARWRKGMEDTIPTPASFEEHRVCQAVNDLAGLIHLESVAGSSYTPYAAIVSSILTEEREHGTRAIEGLSVWVGMGGQERYTETIRLLQFHVPPALRCFGRLDTENDRLAVELGLKTRTARQNAVRYIEIVNPFLKPFGLCVSIPAA